MHVFRGVWAVAVVLLALWGAGPARAQMYVDTGWVTQNAPVADYRDVTAVTNSVAWAVGSGGAIANTSNGGFSWSSQTSGTAATLNSVHALTVTRVWAAGDGGTIVRTNDGGSSWSSQSSTTVQNLRSVAPLTVDVAWAVGDGGTILKTADGGSTWTAQTSGTGVNLRKAAALGALVAWAVGDGGTILKTTDGGATWTAQTSGVGLGTRLLSISALTTNVAWVVGDGGVILKTTNGGSTWSAQTSGTAVELRDVLATNVNDVWAVGASGTILKTTDGGATWSSNSPGGSLSLRAIGNGTTDWQLWAVGDVGKILQRKYWLPSFAVDPSRTYTWSVDAGGPVAPANSTPRILVLPDGSYRMYYATTTAVLSQTSTDGGATWTADSGTRLSYGTDAAIVYLSDGRVRFIHTSTTTGGTAFVSSISTASGRTLTEEGTSYTPPPYDNSDIGVPHAVLLSNGSWRLYYVGDRCMTTSTASSPCNNVRTALSTDEGRTWTAEWGPGTTQQFTTDPDVTYLTSGGHRMFYLSNGNLKYGDEVGATTFATSTGVGGANALAAGAGCPATYPNSVEPTVMRLPGGNLRLFYSCEDTIPVGGGIYSATGS